MILTILLMFEYVYFNHHCSAVSCATDTCSAISRLNIPWSLSLWFCFTSYTAANHTHQVQLSIPCAHKNNWPCPCGLHIDNELDIFYSVTQWVSTRIFTFATFIATYTSALVYPIQKLLNFPCRLSQDLHSLFSYLKLFVFII